MYCVFISTPSRSGQRSVQEGFFSCVCEFYRNIYLRRTCVVPHVLSSVPRLGINDLCIVRLVEFVS